MQTLAVVWLAGGAVCVLAYLIGIWPAFREYARTAGVAFEVFHFGTRALMVFVTWPAVAVAFLVVAAGSREPPRAGSADAEPAAAPDPARDIGSGSS